MARRASILLLLAAASACDGGSPLPPPTIRCDDPPPGCDAAQDLACLDPCRARADVAQLAAPELEGRGTGTAGNEAAAELIAARFQALGLQQVPALGGWRQEFPVDLGGASPVLVPNVVGVIPGTDPALQGQVVVIGAHLDHLGVIQGAVYPGADDDASGVAAVMELARAFAASATRPRRTLLFAAWNGEELGLLGSAYYANQQPLFPLDDTVAALSVDMVGQGNERGLEVCGTSWDPVPGVVPVMRGAAAAAGLDLAVDSPCATESSDHTWFSYQGVPAVLTITPEPHSGYHTPADTVDRIGTENLRAALELIFVTVQAYAQGQDAAWAPAAGAPGLAGSGPSSGSEP